MGPRQKASKDMTTSRGGAISCARSATSVERTKAAPHLLRKRRQGCGSISDRAAGHQLRGDRLQDFCVNHGTRHLQFRLSDAYLQAWHVFAKGWSDQAS